MLAGPQYRNMVETVINQLLATPSAGRVVPIQTPCVLAHGNVSLSSCGRYIALFHHDHRGTLQDCGRTDFATSEENEEQMALPQVVEGNIGINYNNSSCTNSAVTTSADSTLADGTTIDDITLALIRFPIVATRLNSRSPCPRY
jgi:hypothetical protein